MSQGLAPIKKFNYFYKPFIHKISTSNSELLFGFRGEKKKRQDLKFGSHLDPATVLILIKYMFFVVNIMLLEINYVSILIKIKCVNFCNTTDICDKHNFTIKYTYFTIIDTYLLKHT